jgi:uncharacterized protein YggE
MRNALFLVLLATGSFGHLAISAAAQVSPPGRPAAPNTVTVAGDAVVYAPPDRARLRFGVETEGETPEEAFRQHEQEVAGVLAAVRGLGIPDRWIQLEWVGLSERPEQRRGYVATRFVAVTTDSLRLVPELVSAVVDAGADHLAGLEYFLEVDDPFEDEALAAAFDRAEAKARGLAGAAGMRLGPVVAVAEQGVQPPMPYPVPMERMAADQAVSTPGAYATGQSQVHATVVVTFALELP